MDTGAIRIPLTGHAIITKITVGTTQAAPNRANTETNQRGQCWYINISDRNWDN
jgi:hypothetical protein